jgi:hypothetical protein
MSAKIVPLDQVLPGVVLADNVHDDSGRVLLRAGSILSESTIEALHRRAIGSVTVEVADRAGEEHLALERARLESRLQAAFCYAGDGVANRELRQALIEYKLGSKP